jgi:hypothetical protein
MDVLVDGQTHLEITSPATVVEAVGMAVESLRAQGRAVVGVRVNGEDLAPEALSERFADTAAAEVSLELSTRPVLELVLEVLDTMTEMLPELPAACRKLALVFQSEIPEEGYEPFQELAEIWEFVKARQRMAAEALEIDIDTLEVKGQPLREHLRELNSFLEESAQALRDGDTVLLGDLLEYELAPRAELEGEIVSALRRHAEAPAQ